MLLFLYLLSMCCVLQLPLLYIHVLQLSIRIFHLLLLFSASCSPAGNISSTFIAYPAVSPSLYILIIYVTISPFLTVTGVLVCVYIAVVFKVFLLFINGVTSTCGSLFSSPKLSSSVPLTFCNKFS